MKKNLLIACFCLIVSTLHAQYYYQDIYNTAQTNSQHQLFVQQSIKSLSVTSSSSGDNAGASSFTARKILSPDFATMRTLTASDAGSESTVVSEFDSSGKIREVIDSSGSSKNEIFYNYNSSGHLLVIRSVATSIAKGDTFTIAETHRYDYNSEGQITKMERLKNNVAFSTINFELDSSGRVVSEVESGNGVNQQRIYYKYNKKGLLTDVIRYNKKLGRMLPDYMIDYDSSGRLTQMTTVTPETLDYILCKYTYNDKGLKSAETCYGKHQQLLGDMRYVYSYY